MSGLCSCRPALRTLFCVFLLSLPSGMESSRGQDEVIDPVATREYAVALGFQRKKLFEQAADRWTQFIAKHSTDNRIQNAHYHLGVCQLQAGNAQATTTFRGILTQFPKFEQLDAVQFNLGLSLYHASLTSKKPEDFLAASAEFAKLPAQYGQSTHVASALYYQAESIFQAGDAAGAVAVYQKLIAEHGNSPLLPTAFFALATTQQNVGQHEQAIAAYQTLLQKFPNDSRAAESRLRLGLALMDTQKFAEAEREFTTAAGVPNFAMADLALFHQGRSKREQNQLPQAAGLFESLPNRFKESTYIPIAMLEAGKCHFLANQLPQAVNALTAVVNAKSGESAEAAWWLGRTQIQQKQAPAAIGVLDKAIADWPQSNFLPDLQFTRIEAIYEDQNRRPETVKLYIEFADKHAMDELAAAARYRSALIALQLLDLPIALQQSDAFIANPEFAKDALLPDALFVAAECRLIGETPDFVKADSFYRRLLTEFPEHAHAQRSQVRVAFCLYSQKQPDQTIAHLTPILAALKDTELLAEANFLIGLCHQESNRPTEAVNALQAARTAKADWARGDEVLLSLARAMVESNQPEPAIVELNRLIQQYPQSDLRDRAWYRTGEIRAKQKQFDPAVAAFQQVVAGFPQSEFAPLSAYGAASAQFDKGDFVNAINQLNALLSTFPESEVATTAFYLRGLSQHRQNNHGAAVTDLTEFLKRSPGDKLSTLDARYSLALCHAGLKQHEQTIQVAGELLKAKPDYASADKVWYELGFAFQATEKLPESADAFRQLATKFPDSELAPEAWLRVADFHSGSQQFAEAITACDQGLTKVSDGKLRERLRFRKGWSQFSSEKFADASATLQMQVQEQPQGELVIDAAWLIAESMFRQAQYQQALPWYQKAVDAKSEKYHSRALYRSGTCATDLKQWPVAQQHFDALTKQFPQFENVNEALYGLAFAMQNQNQLDQAVQVYEQVTKKTNSESAAKARFMIGECAFAQKKYDVAWQHFLEAALGYPYPEWQALGHFEAARCFMELKMPEKARESLQTVVEKYPQHERAKDAAKLLADLKGT